MSCTRTITLAFISLELNPFDYFPYNFVSTLKLEMVRDISMKLGTLIKHDEMMCHAKEPLLLLAYLWSYFPLIIFHTILCLLYNSETKRDISMKLGTLIKHNEMVCHAEEP